MWCINPLCVLFALIVCATLLNLLSIATHAYCDWEIRVQPAPSLPLLPPLLGYPSEISSYTCRFQPALRWGSNQTWQPAVTSAGIPSHSLTSPSTQAPPPPPGREFRWLQEERHQSRILSRECAVHNLLSGREVRCLELKGVPGWVFYIDAEG